MNNENIPERSAFLTICYALNLTCKKLVTIVCVAN